MRPILSFRIDQSRDSQCGCQFNNWLHTERPVPQLASFTETLVERSSQYFIVTVVFGPAINTVVLPKCSCYYMQSHFLFEKENKRPVSNKRPSPRSKNSFFYVFAPINSNFRSPVRKSCSNAPHVRPAGWANRFKTICYRKYQLACFILKLDKGTSYLHSKASPSFYDPFLVSHSITNAKSCPLNRLTFSLRSSCTNGQIPYLARLSVKFPTPTAVLKLNSPLPGKGRVSNARGMPGEGRRDVEVTN